MTSERVSMTSKRVSTSGFCKAIQIRWDKPTFVLFPQCRVGFVGDKLYYVFAQIAPTGGIPVYKRDITVIVNDVCNPKISMT